MPMSSKAKLHATVAVAAVLTAAVTFVTTKRTMRKRCKRVVFSECSDVPLLTDEFCQEQAEKVCDA